MTDVAQELMTPHEAARWFRRSPSWLRQQTDLQRLGGHAAQPLYHVSVCRAYVLGRLCGLAGEPLRRLQLDALRAACGLTGTPLPAANPPDPGSPGRGSPPAHAAPPASADERPAQHGLPAATSSAAPRSSAPS